VHDDVHIERVEAKRFLFLDDDARDGVPTSIYEGLRPFRLVAPQGLDLGGVDTGSRHSVRLLQFRVAPNIAAGMAAFNLGRQLMERTLVRPRANQKTGRGRT
jgi:hypothetical protein